MNQECNRIQKSAKRLENISKGYVLNDIRLSLINYRSFECFNTPKLNVTIFFTVCHIRLKNLRINRLHVLKKYVTLLFLLAVLINYFIKNLLIMLHNYFC